MPEYCAIFDPAFAHPDMLFGNAGCGGSNGTRLGVHPRPESSGANSSAGYTIRTQRHPEATSGAAFGNATADLTNPAFIKFDKLAKTERASLISVTAEAIAILGTVP
ncbi:MAG TPA: hypothetical protein VMG12_40055 [Polyangiaceae bacterium]|nr:hypothetical protein [Polyangiaceae bacterium]